MEGKRLGREMAKPKSPTSFYQTSLFFCILAVVILAIVIGVLAGIIGLILAGISYNIITVQRNYCLTVLPVSTCSDSVNRADLFIGQISIVSYTKIEIDLRYSMNNLSLIELPGLYAISFRGPVDHVVTDLTTVPSVIPASTSSSTTINFHWTSNKLYATVITDSNTLNSIRDNPQFYIISFFYL